jgi:MoxR-like ATPase
MKLFQLHERVPTTQAEYEAANAKDAAEDKKRLQHALDKALLDGDDERAEELRDALKESTHPDVAKKQREIDRLIASGLSKSHPDVQKAMREKVRLQQQTK